MTRLVLGIHSTPVGASAAVVDERGLCAAMAEERFTRRARSGGFPRSAVAEVLRLAGARADDLTDVAIAGDPSANLAARLAHAARHPAVSAPRAWQRLGRREPSPAELVADAAGARRQLLDNVLATLERHAPGLTACVSASELLTPSDLEREFGMAGGHWHHGELAFDQFYMVRPVPGAAQHRTPLAGLYLCGAACHPGGGVMGLAGRNAARALLQGAV